MDRPDAMPSSEPVLFEAVITPHRSLSGRQALAVGLGMSALSVALGAVLAMLGAWPVLGFSGAEIGLAAVLLTLHARAGRQEECVRLTARSVRVTRRDAAGRVTVGEIPAAWLAVALEEHPGRVPRLVLRRRGAEIEIAQVLGEAEKRAVGASLAEALARLRSPRFDNPQLRPQLPS